MKAPILQGFPSPQRLLEVLEVRRSGFLWRLLDHLFDL